MKLNTPQKDHRVSRCKRIHDEPREAGYESHGHDCVPRQKYPRSGSHHRSPRTRMPSWLTRQCGGKYPQFDSQRSFVHCSSYSYEHVNRVQHNSTALPSKRHSRIYVGNLPSHLGLPNDAYKELFTALYVTAFGSLGVGVVTPVDSFWTHKCRIYGFLQMRGPKEAVNVMLFNGLTLHGRKLILSRPTGYRPEIKNLNADEYVPDQVDGERLKVLVRALDGIIAVPTEGAYLVATQQVKNNELTESDGKANNQAKMIN